jgi:outer membrane protein assembly factor BamB
MAALPARLIVALAVAFGSLTTARLDSQRPAASASDNWPQWRGPFATGESPNGDPPITWSETENIAWKVPIPGSGASTPIIWGDTIYLQTAVPTGDLKPPIQNFTVDFQRTGQSVYYGQSYVQSRQDQSFQLIALDRATGAVRWQRTLRVEQPREGRHPTNTFASASPSTDGARIIAFFGSHGLYALTMTGEVIWEKQLGAMETRNGWGEGLSPALYGDRVIVTWDQEGCHSFIAAFDKLTGREIWRRGRDEPTTWATPLVVPVGSRTLVVTNGTNHVRAYDLASGDEIWEGPGLTFNSIPSPVSGGGMAYLTSGFQGSVLLAIDLAAAHGTISSETGLAWRRDRDTPYVSSPLLYRGALYIFKDLTGILNVLDARTGQTRYGPVRISEIPDLYASPVAAAGRVYVAGRDGATVVLKHGDVFERLAVNRLDDGFDASPAVVGGEIYLRGRQALYRISRK